VTPAAPCRIFEHLFVLGRPAGGKSEFIDFMKRLPAGERAADFGIGRFEEIDDFPWLWTACEADDARYATALGRLQELCRTRSEPVRRQSCC
jgi:hypothetical protein